MATDKNTYDLIVIGGGSGGLAASKEAAKLGRKVALFDFVKPSPQGTTWGLGGTCVNVGCVPKKLMHEAALIGSAHKDAFSYGWKTSETKPAHNWADLVERVHNHVARSNWQYRVGLRNAKVQYINAFAKLINKNTVRATDKKGVETEYTARDILLAYGGRPRFPNIPGALQYGISSDDIFTLRYPPGRVVVVGASYIALECAGFLHGLGCDVTVLVRSILLRGFDQSCAERVGEYMQNEGVDIRREFIPTKVEQLKPAGDTTPPLLKIFYKPTQGGDEQSIECNTILFAIGRDASVREVGLEAAGVKLDAKSGKIVTDDEEKTSTSNIWAVGDILHERPELTPVAIQAGRLWAQRLYNAATLKMDYEKVPTTVFTPLEYSCCGLSEEQAESRFGADNIEVFHNVFQPLEWSLPEKEGVCYVKLVCERQLPNRVLGIHFIGPQAGEVMQGFAAALKCGITKEIFDNTVGIHPTNAEAFMSIEITKRSGVELKAIAGCGGGVCG